MHVFLTGTALASLLLLTLVDAIPYEKPYHIVRFRFCFLAYISLLSIKSNVLKLDTAQKVYYVNKGLFLGSHGLHTWAGTEMRSIVL